ncbi:MAG: DUF1465 family protein [Alphaproteobacteria bacterium]
MKSASNGPRNGLPSGPPGRMGQALIASRSPAYFDRTYNEAMALLIEARDYAQLARDSTTRAAPADALVAHREAFRLTTRLTQIMSWLLAHRAFLNDELTPEQFAAPDWRLGAQKLCHDDSGHDHEAISARLRDLLGRSHHLYMRVSRLDNTRLDNIGTHNYIWPPARHTTGPRKPDA